MSVAVSGRECDVRTARKCYNERTVSRITSRKGGGSVPATELSATINHGTRQYKINSRNMSSSGENRTKLWGITFWHRNYFFF